jgi:hypothetical protein
MTTIAMPVCIGCRHYDRSRLSVGDFCAAFPIGIPAAIVANRVDHREPYEGDRGILFEPVDHEAAAYAEDVFNPAPEEPYVDDEQVEAEVAG